MATDASSGSPPSLAQRVESLRLPPPPPRSAVPVLPWMMALGFAVLSAALYWRSLNSELKTASSESKPAAAESRGEKTTSSVSSGDKAGPAKSGISPGLSEIAGSPAKGTAAQEIAFQAKGYIIPQQQILVSPQVSGRITALNFIEGMRIDEGYVLATLDNTEYLADFERAQAALDLVQVQLEEVTSGNRPDEIKQAQAELAEAKTNLDQAEKSLLRVRDLRKQNISTQQDLDDAQSSFDGAVKRFERLGAAERLMVDGPRRERKKVAEAEVRRAAADLTRAKWRLDNCTIVAPIAGTVLKKNAELGNLVNPVAFNGSFSLCDLADLSKLEVDLNVDERDIAKVFKGQRCVVRAEAFPKRSYEGVVSRLMPIANRAQAALPVRVRLVVPPEEEGMFLKPEMGATVVFYNAPAENPATQNAATQN